MLPIPIPIHVPVPHVRYRFGDVTRFVKAWFGPAADAVRGKIDWIKFGKTMVVTLAAGGTANFATVFAALTDSLLDQTVVNVLPGVTMGIVFLIEFVRRLLQSAKDRKPVPVPAPAPTPGPIPAPPVPKDVR